MSNSNPAILMLALSFYCLSVQLLLSNRRMIEYSMSLLEIAVQKSWNEISHFHALVPVSFEPG